MGAASASQGAVIVCNHRSSVDPFFVQLITGRIVRWMVAAEYFRIPVVGGMLRFMQSIPTRRGVRNYHDLPNSNQRVTDQEIRAFVAKLLTENPDQKMWLENLLKSDAQFLLVGRQSVLPAGMSR